MTQKLYYTLRCEVNDYFLDNKNLDNLSFAIVAQLKNYWHFIHAKQPINQH